VLILKEKNYSKKNMNDSCALLSGNRHKKQKKLQCLSSKMM